MKRFINFNTTTNHSFNSSTVSIENMVRFAKDDGANAIALTDFYSVDGYFEFDNVVKGFKDNTFKPIYGVNIFAHSSNDPLCEIRKVTLLAKNQIGLKNLYKILSKGFSYIENRENYKSVLFDDIKENHEGLLVGFDIANSDLVFASKNKDGYKELLNKFAIADFAKVETIKNYSIESQEPIDSILVKIVKAFIENGKLVIAVCDSNCITSLDETCIDILRMNNSRLKTSYYKTTEEMLDDFSFLGKDEANKVVIENTNAIVDLIKNIELVPDNKNKVYIENAEEFIKSESEKALKEKYGDDIPLEIISRYNYELNNIISNGFATDFYLADYIVKKSKKQNILHQTRGSVAASFIAYLLGITEVNPLPNYYYCKKCKKVIFDNDNDYISGLDLGWNAKEDVICSICQTKMFGDGNNIPPESFFGLDGKNKPSFCLNFSKVENGNTIDEIYKFLTEKVGKNKVFYAGNIQKNGPKLSTSFLETYCKKKNINIDKETKNRIILRLANVNTLFKKFPTNLFIIPNDLEVYDFAPAVLDNFNPILLFNCFDIYNFKSIKHFDVTVSDSLTKLKRMEDIAKVSCDSIDIKEVDIYEFWKKEEFEGLPLNESFYKEIASKTVLIDFSNLVQIIGLGYGTSTWYDNAEIFISNRLLLEDIISSREDIINFLVIKGFNKDDAFEISEWVRKGRACVKGFTEKQEMLLKEHNIPQWYIDSMKKIRYLFPKANLVEDAIVIMKMIWYKTFYPSAFYDSLNIDDVHK